MRGVESRLEWYKNTRPLKAGYCANHVMRALDTPPQGLPDATAVYRRTASEGHIRSGPTPRGSIMYWTGGSGGHGHVAFSLGNGNVRSVDVNGPRTVGDKPFNWFHMNWPTLVYRGWSWWWGNVNTEEQEADMAWRKVVEVGDRTLKDGLYNEVARISLPDPDSDYLLSIQCRLPAGAYARVQFRRVGWGSGATGNQPLSPPDAKATSFTHNHVIKGGGPVAFEIKPQTLGAASTKIETIIAKAVRIG